LFDLGTIDAQECDITRKDGTTARIVRSARILRDEADRVIGGILDLTRLRTLEHASRRRSGNARTREGWADSSDAAPRCATCSS
jgi:hypothetical protein